MVLSLRRKISVTNYWPSSPQFIRRMNLHNLTANGLQAHSEIQMPASSFNESLMWDDEGLFKLKSDV